MPEGSKKCPHISVVPYHTLACWYQSAFPFDFCQQCRTVTKAGWGTVHVGLPALPVTGTASHGEQDTHLGLAAGAWTSAAGQNYRATCWHLWVQFGPNLIPWLGVLFWSLLKEIFSVNALSRPWLCGCNSFPSVGLDRMWDHSCPKTHFNRRKGARIGCYKMLITPNLGGVILFSYPCILTLVRRLWLLGFEFWTAVLITGAVETQLLHINLQ